MKRIEIEKELLYDSYIIKNLSQKEIASLLNVSPSVISNRVKKYNLPPQPGGPRNHLTLDEELIQYIEGELLGDGCLQARRSNIDNKVNSARYTHGTKYKSYLEWLSNLFSKYNLEQSGNILYWKDKHNSISYKYSTRSYVELKSIFERWYPNGKKIVPKDIVLTPTIIKHWYLGDGNFTRRYKDNSFRLTLHTEGFSKKDNELLISKLCELGIICNLTKANYIYIPVRYIYRFFKYIGNCPEEIKSTYGYKWPKEEEMKWLNAAPIVVKK
jgi:transcriptional regulator with XRE-family HTH domain